MKKVAIIGGGKPENTTLIESLVKAVEQSTGEKVQVVNIHSSDAEFLTQKMPIKEVEPFILKSIDVYSPPPQPKRKGYERPYRFHP